VCAEPAIRYIAKHFTGCTISLLTTFPEVFSHLNKIEKIYDVNQGNPNWDKYFVLDCYYAAEALHSEFVHNFNMAIPDYIATCLLKGQLPVSDRNIVQIPTETERRSVPPRQVVIHAGRHWPSKTFPKYWWDEILSLLMLNRIQPTLIGANIDDKKRGTVDVDPTGCLDLRDKLTVRQSVAVLQQASVVITNDSAPLHMAASGDAWIGFMSTVRHPDYVSHWRPNENGRNVWAYKMHDFAKGRMWSGSDTSPLKNGAKYDVIDQATLCSWLPSPNDVVDWTLERLDEENAKQNLKTRFEKTSAFATDRN
jgi:hypothetical protein